MVVIEGLSEVRYGVDSVEACGSFMKKRDANHWEKGDHSGARFDL